MLFALHAHTTVTYDEGWITSGGYGYMKCVRFSNENNNNKYSSKM